MDKNDNQKITLMMDKTNSSKISSFEINNDVKETKKSKCEIFTEYFIHTILLCILYIGLGYIGYMFHFFIRYYILKTDVVFLITSN